MRKLICSLLLLHFLSCAPVAATEEVSQRILHYTMTGRVRLLLFWVGRDNVGRGRVTMETARDRDNGSWTERITVLFGTVPDRVPGRINRWGYGMETGYWTEAESTDRLVSSRFVGFMRHSPEESLSQLSSADAPDTGADAFMYDAIISAVSPDEAHTEIYRFALEEELTYESMERAQEAFDVRRRSGTADKRRSMTPVSEPYDLPQGFLLCLRGMLDDISRTVEVHRDTAGWVRPDLNRRYVYNATPYRLKVERLRRHRDFRLRMDESQPEQLSFHTVAEAEFRIINETTGKHHSFICWFPLEGPLKGIPVQIQDNPRWWLQVRLQLTDLEDQRK